MLLLRKSDRTFPPQHPQWVQGDVAKMPVSLLLPIPRHLQLSVMFIDYSPPKLQFVLGVTENELAPMFLAPLR